MDRKGKEEVGQGISCLRKVFETSSRKEGREGVPITSDVTNGGRFMGMLKFQVEGWKMARKGDRGRWKVEDS
eukprot:evm.model.NODE_27191_length_32237_cov_31.285324.6